MSNNNCQAVSSIVSVMIMLSLLLVIVAVLASYAGGLVSMPEHIPSAEIYVYTTGYDSDLSIVFEHRSGEALKAEDCQIVTFLDDNQGIFMLSDIQTGKFTAGTKVTTSNINKTAKLLGLTSGELSGYLGNFTPMKISVYDLPSRSLLYKSTIILENR